MYCVYVKWIYRLYLIKRSPEKKKKELVEKSSNNFDFDKYCCDWQFCNIFGILIVPSSIYMCHLIGNIC